MRTVWRLVTHHEQPEPMLAWSITNRRLAIGWGSIGSLVDSEYTTADKITALLDEHGDSAQSANLGGQCLYDFRYRMKTDDLVILSTGQGGGRKLVMEVTGDYEWGDTPNWLQSPNYQHQRKARIMDMNLDDLWATAGGRQLSGQNIHSALVQCSNPVDESTLAALGVHQSLNLEF